MSNGLPWFRLYSEFSKDPKIQSMSECMQRRLIMLFCLQCSDELKSLDDDDLSCALRIDIETLHETLQLFQKKKFIDENRKILNWEKRQYKSDNSNERVKKYREKQKIKQKKQECNVTVTPPYTDTDTDTESETKNKGDYFYQGDVFRLNNNDKDRWLKTYSNLNEKMLLAECQKAEDYYKSKQNTENMFFKVSKWLDRVNNQTKPKYTGLTAKDLDGAYD